MTMTEVKPRPRTVKPRIPKAQIVNGSKFGKLTIISEEIKEKVASPVSGKIYHKYYFIVKCDCGKEKKVLIDSIASGKTVSCGCFGNEALVKRSTTHGGKHTSEYDIWCLMRARCYNEKSTSYWNYGAKGIKVCDKWNNSFSNFIDDMGSRPSLKHSIDRYPDKNGDYEPSNCRWATRKEQNNNTSANLIINIGGVDKTFSEWCDFYNVPDRRTYMRVYKLGWDIERAFNTPRQNTGKCKN